jgi:transposase-like protein
MAKCTICFHPQRDAIDTTIRSGASLRNIAKQFNVSPAAVNRHKSSHLDSPQIAQPTKASPASSETRTPTKRPQGQNIPDNLRDQIQQSFIDAFVQHGIVTRACQEVGIHRSILRQWEEHDEEFSLAYNLAKEKVNDIYRDEARRRAVEGTTKYVISQGKIVYVEDENKNIVPLIERQYSDTMLQFIMKARMPEYREKSQMDITSNGQTVAQGNTSVESILTMQQALANELTSWRQGRTYHDDLNPN